MRRIGIAVACVVALVGCSTQEQARIESAAEPAAPTISADLPVIVSAPAATTEIVTAPPDGTVVVVDARCAETALKLAGFPTGYRFTLGLGSLPTGGAADIDAVFPVDPTTVSPYYWSLKVFDNVGSVEPVAFMKGASSGC